MKRMITYGFLWLLIMPFQGRITAQTLNHTDDFRLPVSLVEEKLILSTDRSLYIVSEDIRFSADYLTRRPQENIQWSTVIYLELIDASGESRARGKYKMNGTGASGSFQIPEQLLSGQYYLKAYTKWMRNYPVDAYAYHPLKIVNPFRQEAARTDERQDTALNLEFGGPEPDTEIRIITDRSVYGVRDTVKLTLVSASNHPERYYENSDWSYSLSVVKKGAGALTGGDPVWISAEARSAEQVFWPEIYGISLSGRVAGESGQAAPGALVDLALLDHHSHYLQAVSDEGGRFRFTLPYSEGNYELYVQARKGDQALEVETDPDFCRQKVFPAGPPFSLNETERQLALEMSVNVQLEQRFREQSGSDRKAAEQDSCSFYGKPDKVFYTADYVDLPYVEEFLFEIMPEVVVRTQEDTRVIRASLQNVYASYPFLVLVDNIPVWDHGQVLALKTNIVERFELVDRSYVVGNAKFSGILNVFSAKGDLAGIELPARSRFGQFMMYTRRKAEPAIPENQRIPDRRNCLCWEPGLKIGYEQPAHVSFRTADLTGTYEIILKRVNRRDGSVGYSVGEFRVE